MYRRAILVTTAVLISVSALVGAFPQTASADDIPTPYLAASAVKAATLNTERNSLAVCASKSAFNIKDNPQDIANGKWFSDGVQVRQWFDYNDGGFSHGTNCDKIDINKYITDLGWHSYVQAACDIGLQRTDPKEKDNCAGGGSPFRWYGADKQTVLNRINKVYKAAPTDSSYPPEQQYVMAMSLIANSQTCQGNALGAAGAGSSPDIRSKSNAQIGVVGSDGAIQQVYYTFGGDQKTTWSFSNAAGNSASYIRFNCTQLAGIANKNANAYANWTKNNPPGSAGNAGTCEQYVTYQMGGAIAAKKDQSTHDSLVKACNAGVQNKGTAKYCDDKYPASKDKAAHNACVYGVNTATDGSSSPTAGDDKTCGIDGIGWLVCPVMNIMAKLNDAAYGFLSTYFLSIDTGLVTAAQPSWTKFRDIANVAFVIAILFIVYSQITSAGLNNYGIKKMLPRLMVAALLVNLSFYICAAAVDLSNVIGFAIPQFFSHMIPLGGGAQDTSGIAGAAVAGVGWALIISGVVAGAVGVALAISVPVLLAALLAIGLVILMLIGRQAFIILLIVVSPLAFVAYLLPNTEQWFKKWYKAFFALLILFPVVGAVFGASRMAANIIYHSGNGSDVTIMKIMALAVSAIPFFVVPSLLKGSLAAAGTLGTKIGGMTGKAVNKVSARAKDSSYAGAYMGQRKKIKATSRAQGYGKGVHGKISNAGLSGRAGSELATTGSALSSREEKEAVDNEVVAMQKQNGWTEANRLGNAQKEFVSAMKSGDSTKARAAQQILLSGGNKGIGGLQDSFTELGQMDNGAYESMVNSNTGQKVMSDLSSAGIKSKNAALTQMAYTPPIDPNTKEKNTVDSIAKSAGTYNGLNDAEFAGQSDDNIQNAIDNGGLNQERAQRMQTNDSVWSQLSETKKQKISAVAGPAAAPAAGNISANNQGQSSGQNNAGSLNIPHANNPVPSPTSAPNTPSPTSAPNTPSPTSAPNTPSQTPSGTSNYTQMPSGLYMPPSVSTPRPSPTPTSTPAPTPSTTTTPQQPQTPPPTQPPTGP